MPRVSRMFERCGFTVFDVPGVSRAWQRVLPDRSFVLITDPGGYDLPEPGGPYSGMLLSSDYLLVESQELLLSPNTLWRWIHHLERLSRRNLASNCLTGLRLDCKSPGEGSAGRSRGVGT